jgi:hypothetical protein
MSNKNERIGVLMKMLQGVVQAAKETFIKPLDRNIPTPLNHSEYLPGTLRIVKVALVTSVVAIIMMGVFFLAFVYFGISLATSSILYILFMTVSTVITQSILEKDTLTEHLVALQEENEILRKLNLEAADKLEALNEVRYTA